MNKSPSSTLLILNPPYTLQPLKIQSCMLVMGKDLALKVPLLGKRNFHIPSNSRYFPAIAMHSPELLFWIFFCLATVGSRVE